MPWFKVDDGFHGHPKVVELSLTAVGLWALCGSWCAKYLTDGYVPAKTVSRLGGDTRHAQELVSADLWLDAPAGYQFKDWEDYQPLKTAVEAERAAAQERMRKVRAAKKGVTPNVRLNIDGTSEEVRVTPSQSHPSPDLTPLGVRAANRGTRIPDDFEVTPEMVIWARENTPLVNGKRSTDKFVNHFTSATKNATRIDWVRTWKNWLLSDQERAEKMQPRRSKEDQIVDVLEQGRMLAEQDERKAIA